MTRKAAWREYRLAVAEFERSLRAFAESVGAILEAPPADRPQPEPARDAEGATDLLGALGPRKPPRRAFRSDSTPRTREAGSDG
jgi:hypothetical protein